MILLWDFQLVHYLEQKKLLEKAKFMKLNTCDVNFYSGYYGSKSGSDNNPGIKDDIPFSAHARCIVVVH